jgi:hypothetical protein
MAAKTLTIVAGMALAAGVGVANAGEPVPLTAAQMDQITAGDGGHFWFKDDHHKDRHKGKDRHDFKGGHKAG